MTMSQADRKQGVVTDGYSTDGVTILTHCGDLLDRTEARVVFVGMVLDFDSYWASVKESVEAAPGVLDAGHLT